MEPHQSHPFLEESPGPTVPEFRFGPNRGCKAPAVLSRTWTKGGSSGQRQKTWEKNVDRGLARFVVDVLSCVFLFGGNCYFVFFCFCWEGLVLCDVVLYNLLGPLWSVLKASQNKAKHVLPDSMHTCLEKCFLVSLLQGSLWENQKVKSGSSKSAHV